MQTPQNNEKKSQNPATNTSPTSDTTPTPHTFIPREQAIAEERERLKKQTQEAIALKKTASDYERAYNERIRRMEEEREQGSLAYFISELKNYRPSPAIRIPTDPNNPADQKRILDCLTAAYKHQVASVGMLYLPDQYTDKALADVARWLTTHTKSGLLLRGYLGVGKTTMLKAMAATLKILIQKTLPIVDAREISNLARNEKGTSRLQELTTSPLLGIDDLGTEPQTVKNYGNDLSPISELLTDRYNNRRFTIITTNLAIRTDDNGNLTDELQTTYGDRLADRFREQYNTIYYSAEQKSYRK